MIVFAIILVIVGIVVAGVFFPNPSWVSGDGNFWRDTWTGQITASMVKPIYDFVAGQATDTLACIDQRDGTIEGVSAFEAQVGIVECEGLQ